MKLIQEDKIKFCLQLKWYETLEQTLAHVAALRYIGIRG